MKQMIPALYAWKTSNFKLCWFVYIQIDLTDLSLVWWLLLKWREEWESEKKAFKLMIASMIIQGTAHTIQIY